MASRLALLLVLSLPLLCSSAGLPDGARCTRNKTNGLPIAPYCTTSINCLITNVTSTLLIGRCVSTLYTKKSPLFCQRAGIPYAVGTKNLGLNVLYCPTCTCTADYKINSTYCECDKGPTCYVNAKGTNVTPTCPKAYSTCLISKVGVTVNKVVVDQGNCIGGGGDPRHPYCVSAGATWGPKFYAGGTTKVPAVGNRCKSCTCSAIGAIVNCTTLKGCTTP